MFVGRIAELDELYRRLFVDKECQSMAVYGLGGIGKTQIALSFARIVEEKHSDISIFWITAMSMATINKSFADIAQRLELQPGPNSNEDIKELVKRHFQHGLMSRWMLVVDNVDDLDLVDELLEVLPSHDSSITFFTSRSSEVVQALFESDALEIMKLGVDQAVELMGRLMLNKKLVNDSAMGELLQDLDYFPLALTQAAAYMNRNKTTPTTYLKRLRGTDKDMAHVSRIEH